MGIRVMKTAVAAVIAVYIAQWMELDFALSAGLLAILGVDVTKKRGLISAFQRIAASIMGLLFAFAVFALFGFHVWVLGLYILISYPILARLQLKDGIVTSSVVMLHVYGMQDHSLPMLENEALLLLIGLGTATLINFLYMPNAEKPLQGLKEEVERTFAAIFLHMAEHLRDTGSVWDGQELTFADQAVEAGIELSKRYNENQLFRGDAYWLVYFEMRRAHLDTMQHMLTLLAQVYQTLPHGQAVAELFEELSEDVKSPHYTGITEEMLRTLDIQFKQVPMPESRAEFEVRAAIYQLLRELERYLEISKRFKRKAPQRR